MLHTLKHKEPAHLEESEEKIREELLGFTQEVGRWDENHASFTPGADFEGKQPSLAVFHYGFELTSGVSSTFACFDVVFSFKHL